MNIAESFVAIAQETFAFLVREHHLECKEEQLGASWLGVRYRGEKVIVQFVLESDIYVLSELIPLVDGVEPRRFDADLREHTTTLKLAEVLELLDPDWRKPARERVSNADEVAEVLTAYAAGIRGHVNEVLDPDPRLLDQVRVSMSRRSLLELLGYWARFVEEVRRGYAGGISTYVRSVATRAVLEDTTDWNDPLTADSRRQLLQLDALFEQATEPLPWGRGNILPTPRAARWWRKPRILTQQLAEQFRREGL